MLRIEASLNYRIEELARDEERLHVLCPAGIGDVAWIGAKLFPLARQRGNLTFWLPEAEQQRAGRYLQLLGVEHGYLPRLTTRWVWNQPGEPELPPRGCVVVQANRHLESGRRIESWYPDLPVKWPRPRLPRSDSTAQEFCLLFPGSRHYMGGNIGVGQWLSIARWLHCHIAPVRLIGAGADIEFVREIAGHYGGGGHLFDRPLEEVLAAAVSARCRVFVGVASGPLIAATYLGARCFYGYPGHLVAKMPGTFEPPEAIYGFCLLQELVSHLGAVAHLAK
jgi:hypothetical protein